MSKPSVLQRLNHHVTSGKGKVLDLSRDAPDEGFSHFAGLPASAMSATIVSHMQYFLNPEGLCVCYVVCRVLCCHMRSVSYVCVALCCMCAYVVLCVCTCVYFHMSNACVDVCTGYGIS